MYKNSFIFQIKYKNYTILTQVFFIVAATELATATTLAAGCTQDKGRLLLYRDYRKKGNTNFKQSGSDIKNEIYE